VIQQVAGWNFAGQVHRPRFLSGLHGSPFQGASVEFAEHRVYTPADDIKTRLERVRQNRPALRQAVQGRDQHDGHLSSTCPGRWGTRTAGAHQVRLRVCLAAALGYLMSPARTRSASSPSTQDSHRAAAKAKRSQIGALLSVLANSKPAGETDAAEH